MTRIKAEAGCCQLKGILILRPNFHQVEDPVDGNMLMTVHPGYCPIGLHVGSLSQSFPAYRCARPPPSALDQQTPGGPQRRARLANDASLLGANKLGTTRLVLTDGRITNIRQPSQPDDEAKRVCQILGID